MGALKGASSKVVSGLAREKQLVGAAYRQFLLIYA